MLYFRHDSSLEHETGAHPEQAARIPAIEAALEARDWLGYERVDAPEADVSLVTAVHPQSHVDAVRGMSEGGGGWFDPDTYASPGSYRAALHGAGGATAMVEALLGEDDVRVGFCGLRPPGHHAETATAMGFCLFNNVAIAASHALDALGAQRVFVLDWDVHHGNGTNEIFHSSPQVLFASIHQSPLYPGTGALGDTGSGEGEGFALNLPVPPGSGEDVWLSLVEHVAIPAARAFEPDLVLVSAGFDAHRDDPLANCMLETSSFAEMARHARSLDVPVGAVLEGGYDLDALSASVVATLEALASDGSPRSVEPDELTAGALSVHGARWGLS